MDVNYLYINAGHRFIPADILLADRFFTRLSLNKEVIIIIITDSTVFCFFLEY